MSNATKVVPVTIYRRNVSPLSRLVANETPVSEPGTAFLERLDGKARTLDNTRLVAGALEGHTRDGFRVIDDPFGKHLDVIGINNYCGWYYASPESCAGLKWKSAYDKTTSNE